MQQNLEILDVSMFVASSFSIVIAKEEIHVFTNPRPFGPC
jgi:hypothetical protein